MAFALDETHMRATEAILGRRLPEPLRSRLLRDNGGELETEGDVWQLNPVFDPTDRKRIGRTANHIVKETEIARQQRHFPPNAIAVGHNGAGDLLILREDAKEIAMWLHETGETVSIDVLWRYKFH